MRLKLHHRPRLRFSNKYFVSFQLKESRPQKVELKRVSFKSSGEYRCEVTAKERPALNSYGGQQGRPSIKMKESINRMTVVGKLE